MLGSTFSNGVPEYDAQYIIVAESLSVIADELEKGREPMEVVREIIKAHKRIVFNGNNYADEWVDEAEKRGLLNLRSTADALPHYTDEKNVALFTKHGVLSKEEVYSRCEILLENYNKTLNIEVQTMLQMVKKDILPAVSAFVSDMSVAVINKQRQFQRISTGEVELDLVKKVSGLQAAIYKNMHALEEVSVSLSAVSDPAELAMAYKNNAIPAMEAVRTSVDAAEELVGTEHAVSLLCGYAVLRITRNTYLKCTKACIFP